MIGCLLCKFAEVWLQLCGSGFRRYSGSELDERAVLLSGSIRKLQREIDIRPEKSKMGRHDADYGVGLVHELNGLAYHRLVAVVVMHPELVAQHNDRLRILTDGSVRREVIAA